MGTEKSSSLLKFEQVVCGVPQIPVPIEDQLTSLQFEFCPVMFAVRTEMIVIGEGHRSEVGLTKSPYVPLSTWSFGAADCDLNTL